MIKARSFLPANYKAKLKEQTKARAPNPKKQLSDMNSVIATKKIDVSFITQGNPKFDSDKGKRFLFFIIIMCSSIV